jgi:hypothetical protein
MTDDDANLDVSEERIAELLGLLRPPPPGWSQAAIDLPAARAALDEMVGRALADRAARDAVLADLEGAVRAAGFEPGPQLIADLRARLGGAE